MSIHAGVGSKDLTTHDKNSFLDLPGELRNEIYEACVADYAPTTVSLIGKHLASPPLDRASKQVRQEFSSLRGDYETNLSKVKHLEADVLDLDFGPLIGLLDRFVDHDNFGDGKALERISVRLVFTSACRSMGSEAVNWNLLLMQHWVGLCGTRSDINPDVLKGVKRAYSVSFDPDIAVFDGTLMAERLGSFFGMHGNREFVSMRQAVEEAVRKGGASGGSASSVAKDGVLTV